MDRAAFAKLIKSKYPQYASIADEELVNRVLEKHPEYKSQIDPPISAANETAAIASRGAFGAVGQDESGQPVDAKGNLISREPKTAAGGFVKHITDSFSHNPLIQGSAEPQSTSDFLNLLLMTGAPDMAAPAKEFAGRSVAALKAANRETSGWSKLSLPARAIGKFNDALPSADAAASRAMLGGATPVPPDPITIMPNKPDLIDKYSRVKAPAQPNTAMSSSMVDDILNELRASRPSGGNELPPTGDITPGGPLNQSGKVGRTSTNPNNPYPGKMGQAGGYTSGRPAVTPTRYDEMLGKLGGSQTSDVGATGTVSAPDTGVAPSQVGAARADLPSATDRLRSTEPVDEHWHSGAEPGSPEARSAQSLHQSDAELNQRYKQHTGQDSLLKMILAGLTGGSVVGASAPGSQQ